MASQGPLYTGTGANFNDGGTLGWTNPTNIQGDTTGIAATITLAANGNTSQRLRCSNFGFSIPAGSTIDGITVEVEQQTTTVNRNRWNSVRLLIATAESGTDQSDATTIPATKGFKTFGGAANLWGLTPTVAQVNDAGFGVSLKIDRNSASSTTTSFFRVRITVTYHTDATTTLSVSSQASVVMVKDGFKNLDVTGNGSSVFSRISNKILSVAASPSTSLNLIRNVIKTLSVAVSTVSTFATEIIGGTFSTGLAVLTLSPKPPPLTRTNHTIYIKGRVTTAGTAKLHAALYEAGVNISGDLDSGNLTTSLVEYALPISDAAAATIDNYDDLEVRMWGTSSSSLIFEVSEVYLKIPGALALTTLTLQTLGQGSAILMKSTSKYLSVIGQGAAAMISLPSKVFSITVTRITKLQLSPIHIFSAIGQGSAFISTSLTKILTVVSQPVATFIKTAAKNFFVSISRVTTIIKLPSIHFSVTGQGSTNLTTIKVKLVSFLVTGQATVTIKRDVVKLFSVVGQGSASFVKSLAKAFSVVGSGSVNLIKTALKMFAATGQGSAFIAFFRGRIFSITVITETKLSLALTKAFFVGVNVSVNIAKFIQRQFSVIGQASAELITSTVPLVVRGFYTATMAREGYFRSYITKFKGKDSVETSHSDTLVTKLKSDEEIDREGYSSDHEF